MRGGGGYGPAVTSHGGASQSDTVTVGSVRSTESVARLGLRLYRPRGRWAGCVEWQREVRLRLSVLFPGTKTLSHAPLSYGPEIAEEGGARERRRATS